ncbi:MAG: oxygenase MpaB family protein [Acidimicrobiales bacterium]
MTSTGPAAGSRDWSDSLLDGMRSEADTLADDLVAGYFARAGAAGGAGRGPSHLFRRLVAHGQLPPEDRDPGVAAYLAGSPPLPDWLDPAAVARGQECFARWGFHVFTALYAGSLPTAYACARGVQVLGLTARLVTDAQRRLNETAQFHLDVMSPGGLGPGGAGLADARRVRLMHAAVRWLIGHDPQVTWDPVWGSPINQEDLVETLLSFTEVVFEVFDRAGVAYDDGDAEAYLHTWSVVGHLLGIRPDLLPLHRPDTRALMAVVRRRQFAPSAAGRALAAALLDQGRRLTPPGLRGLPATAIRYLVGDEVADLLDLPRSDWTRVVFGPLAKVSRRLSAQAVHHRLVRAVSARAGRGMLQLAVSAERGGDRPAFAIPGALADRWGVPAGPPAPARPPS